MASPIQKDFRGWFGAVLSTFRNEIATLPSGKVVALTDEQMAGLLECSEETIKNYRDQETAAGSEKIALFFAKFPPAVVEYALQHLQALRPGHLSTGSMTEFQQFSADATVVMARINHRVAVVTVAGEVDADQLAAADRDRAELTAILARLTDGMARAVPRPPVRMPA